MQVKQFILQEVEGNDEHKYKGYQKLGSLSMIKFMQAQNQHVEKVQLKHVSMHHSFIFIRSTLSMALLLPHCQTITKMLYPYWDVTITHHFVVSNYSDCECNYIVVCHILYYSYITVVVIVTIAIHWSIINHSGTVSSGIFYSQGNLISYTLYSFSQTLLLTNRLHMYTCHV